MSNLLLALLAASALALSGCATSPSSGGKQQTEMIKLPDAISAFENARREEISYAERVRIDLINIFQSNKGSAEALVEPLQLTQTMVTDKSSGKSQSVTTFDSLVIIMPLALRGTPTADKFNAQIKYIANKIADDRGSSQIRFSLLSADAKTNGIKLETATVESPNGNPVQVSRVADKNIAKGMQRVLIKANSIPNGDTLLINAVNTTGKGCKLESLLEGGMAVRSGCSNWQLLRHSRCFAKRRDRRTFRRKRYSNFSYRECARRMDGQCHRRRAHTYQTLSGSRGGQH